VTDKEEWKMFLDKYNLGYTEETDNSINLMAHVDKNIKGYSFFHMSLLFDKEDSFIQLGLWE
jgi:hypothetical protein